jgi:multidrug efflux pump subunit AcrB
MMKEHNELPGIADLKRLTKGKINRCQIFAQSGITAESEKIPGNKENFIASKKLSRFDKFRNRYMGVIDFLMTYKKSTVLFYVFSTCILVALFFTMIGQDVLLKSNAGQFQLRIRDKGRHTY